MLAPVKPFPNYKWRWATTTPTEGLNAPPAFLGVLRAMRASEGKAASSAEFEAELAKVKKDVKPDLDLTRSRERNIIRNSGQYWKALGLLGDSKGAVQLTPLGHRLADGKITPEEFAATTVRTMKLPNSRIESDTAGWDKAGLEIKPLELILKVVDALASRSATAGYITPEELIRIVIPLAGEKRPVDDHAKSILLHRDGKLDIGRWPDCVPGANDHRMAKEFLLFLGNYGLLDERQDESTKRYYKVQDTEELLVPAVTGTPDEDVPEALRRGGFSFTERTRRTTTTLSRPGQAKFRRQVLAAYGKKCILTGLALEEALDAGHIVPVEDSGPDDVGNGICLRSDIHALFDAGHIKIDSDGTVHLSDAAKEIPAYAALPKKITWPKFVHPEAIAWRYRYC